RDRRYAARSVSGIDDGFQLSRAKFNSRNDVGDIIVYHPNLLNRSCACCKFTLCRDAFDFLNLLAKKRFFTEADLEAVMIGRIVGAGDHHTAIDGLGKHGVVKNRGRYHADRNYVDSGTGKFMSQNFEEARRAFPGIETDGDLSGTVSDVKPGYGSCQC